MITLLDKRLHIYMGSLKVRTHICFIINWKRIYFHERECSRLRPERDLNWFQRQKKVLPFSHASPS